MHLSPDEHRQAARSIYEAEQTGEWTEPVSNRWEDADIEDAYRIGLEVRDLKVANGRTEKGHKIGFTSKAMRSLVGATEPDYGVLDDDWFVVEGSVVPRSTMNRPLVEQELAFVMGSRLAGPSVNAADVIRATDFVLPALEIVDSRFSGRGKTLLVDSTSDAASCGFVVLGGNPARLTDVDVRRISGSLAINGDIMETGTAAAVMGTPAPPSPGSPTSSPSSTSPWNPATSSAPAPSSRPSPSTPATPSTPVRPARRGHAHGR